MFIPPYRSMNRFLHSMGGLPNWSLGALGLLGVICILIAVSLSGCSLDDDAPVLPELPEREYIVQRGDTLTKIAQREGVTVEALRLRNEPYLVQQFEDTCSRFDDSYRNNPNRKGLYCNERYRDPYKNTLRAGWRLMIPSPEAPGSVMVTVGNIKGKDVVLVIDDSGSMADDVVRVGAYYAQALEEHGKNLTAVVLYADRNARLFRDGERVEFATTGSWENTFGALQKAAEEDPDAIILITDEYGDDWDWDEVGGLPPVTAHCLPENGVFQCEDSLKRLVSETGGSYRSTLW